MAFMERDIQYGMFLRVETVKGEGCILPPELFNRRFINAVAWISAGGPIGCSGLIGRAVREYVPDTARTAEVMPGWYGRLSAPGYMDCTDWTGPYDTEDKCRAELDEMYGSDDSEDGEDSE